MNGKLNFNTHIMNSIKKATSVGGMLYSILNGKSPVLLSNRIQLFNMYVTPKITYAGAAWALYVTKS